MVEAISSYPIPYPKMACPNLARNRACLCIQAPGVECSFRWPRSLGVDLGQAWRGLCCGPGPDMQMSVFGCSGMGLDMIFGFLVAQEQAWTCKSGTCAIQGGGWACRGGVYVSPGTGLGLAGVEAWKDSWAWTCICGVSQNQHIQMFWHVPASVRFVFVSTSVRLFACSCCLVALAPSSSWSLCQAISWLRAFNFMCQFMVAQAGVV